MIPEGLRARRIALSPDVRFGGTLRRGPARLHLILDRRTGRLMEVGPREHFIITRLDGTRSLADIGEEYAAHFGRRLGAGGWQAILGLLGARGLLADGPRSGRPTPPAGAAARPVPAGSGPFRGGIRLNPASATLDRLFRALGFAVNRYLVPPALLLITVMEVQLCRNARTLLRQAWGLRGNPGPLSAVVAVLAVSLVLHELAHGVAARRFGATVTEIGLRWRFPGVTAYCQADDYLLLRSRKQQVATAGAGVYMNLLLLLPFFAASVVITPTGAAADALAGLLLLGSFLALINLAPIPPLDGYKMLSHALGMSGYATESFRFMRLVADRVRGRRGAIAAYPKAARVAYAGYALGSVAAAGAAAAGLVLLSHHLLAGRFGATAAVVPAVLFIAGTAANVITRQRRRGERPARKAEDR